MAPRNGLLIADPTVSIAYHRPDDRFIPLRRADIAAALAADAARFGPEASQLPALADAIADVVEQEAHTLERRLCGQYEAVNPDRDTLPTGDLDALRSDDFYRDVLASLDVLLGKANFARLGEADLRGAVRAANSHGLRVRLRPDRIASLSVWARGESAVQRRRHTWRHPIAGVEQTLPVYRRLVVVARLKNDPNIVLKLFKEIPVADIEALLPHAEVRMGLLDRIKVMGGGAGMAGSTAAKFLNVLANFAYWSRMMWVVLLGGAVLAVRTMLGYRKARELRDSQRTRHLYYQNLDNNLGVIHTLVSMVAHEETKEALLAYAFCAAGGVMDADALRRRVESYLQERFDLSLDFDVHDALRTLQRLNLWQDAARYAVAPAAAALQRLRDHVQSGRTADCHAKAVSAAMADGGTAAPFVGLQSA